MHFPNPLTMESRRQQLVGSLGVLEARGALKVVNHRGFLKVRAHLLDCVNARNLDRKVDQALKLFAGAPVQLKCHSTLLEEGKIFVSHLSSITEKAEKWRHYPELDHMLSNHKLLLSITSLKAPMTTTSDGLHPGNALQHMPSNEAQRPS